MNLKLSDEFLTQIAHELKAYLAVNFGKSPSAPHVWAVMTMAAREFHDKRGLPIGALAGFDFGLATQREFDKELKSFDANDPRTKKLFDVARGQKKKFLELTASPKALPMADLEAAFSATLQGDVGDMQFATNDRWNSVAQNFVAELLGNLDAVKVAKTASPNNPTLAYYAEFDGSYAFSKVPDPRARGVYSLNLRYNFDASKADTQYLLVSLEYGKTRAQPTVPVSSVTVLFNYKF